MDNTKTGEQIKLPDLPKPEVRCGEYAGPAGEGASEDLFSADQMREYTLAALSQLPQAVQPNEELESVKRMFYAACEDLGAINEALGLDPDDGGAEPILAAIDELKAVQPTQECLTLLANLTAIVRVQNGNRHSDVNALLDHADRILDSNSAQAVQPTAECQHDYYASGQSPTHNYFDCAKCGDVRASERKQPTAQPAPMPVAGDEDAAWRTEQHLNDSGGGIGGMRCESYFRRGYRAALPAQQGAHPASEWNDAIEAAVKACDQIEGGEYPDGEVASGLAWECAAAIRALKRQPSESAQAVSLTDEFINALILRICELPDRTSPEDDPEAMVCTPEELRNAIRCTEEEFAELQSAPQAAEQKAQPVAGAVDDLLCALGEVGIQVSGGTHGDRFKIKLPRSISSAPSEPKESEWDKVDAKELLTAALNVTAWDWSDNDSDCVRDMQRLRDIAERLDAARADQEKA